MNCTGCKLGYSLLSGTNVLLATGIFNIVGGYAASPVYALFTTGNAVKWGTITAVVSNGASHGVCTTGQSGTSGCVESTPCSGLRSAVNTTTGNYQFHILNYNANSNNPFHCNTQEYVEFYGELSGVQVSPVYKLSITCNGC